MMRRSGFVSNSSSSSFVCTICSEIESGWDASLSEFDMVRCEKGHEFHIDCAQNPSSLQEILDEAGAKDGTDEDGFDYEEYRYILPSKYCPVCNFVAISDKDLLKYLMRGRSKSEILENIVKEYETYERFKRSFA